MFKREEELSSYFSHKIHMSLYLHYDEQVNYNYDFIYSYHLFQVEDMDFNWKNKKELILSRMLDEMLEKEDRYLDCVSYRYGDVKIKAEDDGYNNLGSKMIRYDIKIPIRRIVNI